MKTVRNGEILIGHEPTPITWVSHTNFRLVYIEVGVELYQKQSDPM